MLHFFPSTGGGTRDRTADLLHAMQALSQLSYTPVKGRPHYRESAQACKVIFTYFFSLCTAKLTGDLLKTLIGEAFRAANGASNSDHIGHELNSGVGWE